MNLRIFVQTTYRCRGLTMDFCKYQAQIALKKWFDKAANWQKDLFTTLWNGVASEEKIIERAIKLVGQEYLSEDYRISPNTTFPADIKFDDTENSIVMLKSISDVKGIAALAPQSELTFGDGLSVVYGENGSGKSSYVRILKALENPTYSDAVIGNVFEADSTVPEALITFSLNGNPVPVRWGKVSKKKYPLQIYDTATAKQFVDKENEVVYEPKALSAITQMAKIYEKISAFYEAKLENLSQKITQIPPELEGHTIVQEYARLSSLQDAERFAKRYPWNSDLAAELSAIIASLKDNDPQKTAVEKNAQKDVIRSHGSRILHLEPLVADSHCTEFLEKRKKQISSKEKADALISSSQNHSLIDGFGTDNWKSMWEYASEYIKGIEGFVDIPSTSTGLCALCQQKLDSNATFRLQTFKAFIESTAMTEADTALQSFEMIVRSLQENIENKVNIAEIKTALQSARISKEIMQVILEFYTSILARCEWLLSYNNDTAVELPPFHTKDKIIVVFREIVTKIEAEVSALQKTATDRAEQTNRANNLLAMQWANANLPIKRQLISLNIVTIKCKTNILTSLKKDLSKLLITETYISKFQAEMSILDVKRQIKVELIAKAPKKGKSYHQVSLRGACSAGNHKNGEILSEGEYRVVSLAAFLADLSSWNKAIPFIFDDPITSLDHKFEARVAKRLIQLSMERQVVVFTHRLAFAQLLHQSVSEYNAEASRAGKPNRAQIKHIELRNSPLGQPTEPTYLQRIKMASALKNMINSDIAQVKRLQKDGDYGTADHMIQSLAARFRNLIEQGIEHELLVGIISRFDYRILSQKLPYLFALTAQDIALFHKMMTQYSCYDHSQSIETNVSLPNINDLETDMETMLGWTEDYKKRCDDAKRKSDGKE